MRQTYQNRLHLLLKTTCLGIAVLMLNACGTTTESAGGASTTVPGQASTGTQSVVVSTRNQFYIPIGGSAGDIPSTTTPYAVTYTGFPLNVTAPTATGSSPTTNVSLTSQNISVTFSEAMLTTFLTNVGTTTNVPVTSCYVLCGSSTTESSGTCTFRNSTTLSIPPNSSDAWPASSTCTLHLGEGFYGLKDPYHNYLTATTAYSFTTACALNDAFNSSTALACWTDNSTGVYSIARSNLNVSLASAATLSTAATLSKNITKTLSTMVFTLKVNSVSGSDSSGDGIGMRLINLANSNYAALFVTPDGSGGYTLHYQATGVAEQTASYTLGNTIQITASNASTFWSTGVGGSGGGSPMGSDDVTIQIIAIKAGATTVTGTMSDFTATGATLR